MSDPTFMWMEETPLEKAEKLGHVTDVDVLKKSGPTHQGICKCGWRAGFIRYAKHNSEHDCAVHIKEILAEVRK